MQYEGESKEKQLNNEIKEIKPKKDNEKQRNKIKIKN